MLQPAHVTTAGLSQVEARANFAISHDPFPSRGNFVFIQTLLKPDSALIVELTALKRKGPVQIVLTLKEAPHVYSCGSLLRLCDTTYSLMIETETAKSGDELAVLMTRGGDLYISHNNRSWIKRVHLDPDLEYHLIFDMQLVSVLSILGMTTGVGDIGENQAVGSPETPRLGSQDDGPRECIICLENARNVAIKPCFHIALCESCARTLHGSDEPKCPVCRVLIGGIQKIYFA